MYHHGERDNVKIVTIIPQLKLQLYFVIIKANIY